ncbi:DNA damage-binding protein 2-like [Mercenaria mercenaria]|uniref:DNA damage-binding protein 2-like n=1 Tax=Mercenaria mercenaria TaxID=6596 RepID=UPI00234F4321|nr:DNA damage-binding protein 2-like [Mercenaria mercenaria]
MVGKRQLRSRSSGQKSTENENSGSLAKKAKTLSSGKTTKKKCGIEEKQCELETFEKTPLTAVDKNKIFLRTERSLSTEARRESSCDKTSDCLDREIETNVLTSPAKTDQAETTPVKATVEILSHVEARTSHSNAEDSFLKDLMKCGLKERQSQPKIRPFKPVAETSQNMMHVFQQFSYGMKCRVQIQEAVKSPVINLNKDFELYRTASPFDRRVTAMEWHPTKPSILAVGSKGGDIILWDTDNVHKDKFVHGIGAAGSCQAMKFWPWDTDKMVSASINGTVTLHDFETKQGTVLADTMDSYDHWYCSLDVNPSRYLVVAGRNGGILHMMSTEGRKVFEYHLHKNKITHVEFSPREEWLLCTASTDQTVQMWDVRYMKDRKSALHILRHDKPANSAYFSHTDGCRLLTTDQNKEIRVYRAPFWHLETTIEHPHRFFQHISPFKATWHPLQDLIVCGRYPDKKVEGSTGFELRTLDILDADTGRIVSQLYSQGTDGLCPLNKFNNQGDALASGMGFHILLWNRKQEVARKQSLLTEAMINTTYYPGSQNLASGSAGSNQRSRQRPRQQKKKTDEDVDDLKKKMKTKTKEKVENVKEKKKSKKEK